MALGTESKRLRSRPDTLDDGEPREGVRPGFVHRARVLRRLVETPGQRCVLVVAPAGYGKSTLLEQWEQDESRLVVGMSLVREDNDPVALFEHLRDALTAGGIDSAGGAHGADLPAQVGDRGVEGVLRMLRSVDRPVVVLIDQVDGLHTRRSKDAIARLADGVPPQVTLGLASRRELPLDTGRLRSAGLLVEVGFEQLAMDADEARELYESMGLDVADRLESVLERTEGWPVALYLSALAEKASPSTGTSTIGGDDRYFGDFVDEAIMSHISEGRTDFLLRTSILDRLSGPLCDFVLEAEGSARRLRMLEESNMLIVPLDRTRTWYRYHHLLGEYLVAELDRRSPAVVERLHRRAAVWYDEHGMSVAAVHHAQQADDEELVADLITRHARTEFTQGRFETVTEWFRWLDRESGPPSFPGLAATGALVHAWMGDLAEAERWMARAIGDRDDSSHDPLIHLVRAMCCPSDLAQMTEDAAAALAGLPADSDWHMSALALRGFTDVLNGNTTESFEHLDRAAVHGERFSGLGAASAARAIMAAMSIDAGDWHAAHRHADAAVNAVVQGHMEELSFGCLAFSVASRCATHAGDAASAQWMTSRAATAGASTTESVPIVSTFALVQLARAHLERGDVAGARHAARAASRIMVRRPSFGTLTEALELLDEQLGSLPAGSVGASSLTSAELRLLPHLATHLTFAEIGDRLFVSRHTVKTQAMSIYRKLEVSSRSEAVERATELGFLLG